ncbi:hypothetical protein [Saccharothrix lopnurensis]|uniref:Uncharacterized protein n=1 Tax=Saccharothrix lopnurensis TaxID=1670621 RepID=A0ABW1PEJ4_9PSEU
MVDLCSPAFQANVVALSSAPVCRAMRPSAPYSLRSNLVRCGCGSVTSVNRPSAE